MHQWEINLMQLAYHYAEITQFIGQDGNKQQQLPSIL